MHGRPHNAMQAVCTNQDIASRRAAVREVDGHGTVIRADANAFAAHMHARIVHGFSQQPQQIGTVQSADRDASICGVVGLR